MGSVRVGRLTRRRALRREGATQQPGLAEPDASSGIRFLPGGCSSVASVYGGSRERLVRQMTTANDARCD